MDLKKFKNINLWEIALLVITFLFGMGLNLFIEVPKKIDTASFWGSFGSWILRVHMTLAVAILVLSIIILVGSKNFKKTVRMNSLFGLISVLIAITGGVLFTFFGTNDIFSYIMAIGFIIALMIYTSMLSIIKKDRIS